MILDFPGGPTVPIKVFVRERSRRLREGDGTKQRGLELLQSCFGDGEGAASQGILVASRI